MSTTLNPLTALQEAAEAVRQQLQVNAFDAEAVVRLAEFIEAQRVSVQPADRQNVTMALGCFLGECMVQVYQGQWATGPDGHTGVGIGGKHFFNPFYRVNQQLLHGAAESVATFFASVPGRMEEKVQRNNWIK